jgi:hypothetical protein
MDGLHRLPQLRERTSLGLDGPRWHVDQKQIEFLCPREARSLGLE